MECLSTGMSILGKHAQSITMIHTLGEERRAREENGTGAVMYPSRTLSLRGRPHPLIGPCAGENHLLQGDTTMRGPGTAIAQTRAMSRLLGEPRTDPPRDTPHRISNSVAIVKIGGTKLTNAVNGNTTIQLGNRETTAAPRAPWTHVERAGPRKALVQSER